MMDTAGRKAGKWGLHLTQKKQPESTDLCSSKCCDWSIVCELNLEDRPLSMKYCQFHPRRRRKLIFNNYYKLHNYRAWHSKSSSSTFTFTGWAEWLGASKAVDIWNVLITVSWYRSLVRRLSKYFWWLGIVTDRLNYRNISYAKAVEFKIMREMRRARRVIISNFRRAEFCQQWTASWNPIGGCLQDERTKETGLTVPNNLLRAQKGTILICRIWTGVPEGGLTRKLLTELRCELGVLRK